MILSTLTRTLLICAFLGGMLQATVKVSYTDRLSLDLSSFPTEVGCDIWLSKDGGRSWTLVGKTFKKEDRFTYKAQSRGQHLFHIHMRQNENDDYRPAPGSEVHASIVLKEMEQNNPDILYSNRRKLSISYEVNDITNNLPGSNFQSWLYYTTTSGLSWKLYGPDPDGQSPVPFSTDRDGLYGFKVISSDIAGQKEAAPGAGVPPDILVRIDTQAPSINILSPQPFDLWEKGSTRQISWSATDEAMDRLDAVSLYYSVGVEGNWQKIADQLPSSGSIDWKVPPSENGRLYIQARATDKSGNQGFSNNQPPFFTRNVLEELLEPSVRRQADDYFETATICRKNRDFPKAIKYYRLTLQLNPYHVRAFNDSGITLLRMGLTREAFDQFEGGLKYAPSEPSLLVNMAHLYFQHQQWQEAEQILTRLVTLYPREPDGLWLLSELRVLKGDVEKARELWNRILRLEFPNTSRGPRYQVLSQQRLAETSVGVPVATSSLWSLPH